MCHIHTPRYLDAHFDTKGALVKGGSSSERVACDSTSVIANWGPCASLGDFCSSWSQVEGFTEMLCRVTWVLNRSHARGGFSASQSFWPLSQMPSLPASDGDLLSLTLIRTALRTAAHHVTTSTFLSAIVPVISVLPSIDPSNLQSLLWLLWLLFAIGFPS